MHLKEKANERTTPRGPIFWARVGPAPSPPTARTYTKDYIWMDGWMDKVHTDLGGSWVKLGRHDYWSTWSPGKGYLNQDLTVNTVFESPSLFN